MGILRLLADYADIVAVIHVIVLAAAATANFADDTTATWAAAQLVHALWPYPTQFAETWQSSSWRAWEAETGGAQSLTLPEFAPGDDFLPNLAEPFIARGLLREKTLAEFGSCDWLTQPPVADVVVDYFTDAGARQALVPDGRAPVGDVAKRILRGGREKLGTEQLFRHHPALLDRLVAGIPELGRLFGSSHFQTRWLGSTLTAVTFMAGGGRDVPADGPGVRTDLHAEPIGNVMLMLSGRKRWTLAPANASKLLRPRLSPDGRAYFFCNRSWESRLDGVPHWEVETRAGDLLWVPTWTWHAVDYAPLGDDKAALSVSLFHFRAAQAVTANWLFSALAVPNVLKEVIGWKTQ